MISYIVIPLLTVFLYSSANAISCDVGNPCQLGGHYIDLNGYMCLNINTQTVMCTCPSLGAEINKPCRMCQRTNPADNACLNTNGLLEACLESDLLGSGLGYTCLCHVTPGDTPYPTTDRNCGDPAPATCLNGGVHDGNQCRCLCGFTGDSCEIANPSTLCSGVKCKNNGACAIRNPLGPYQAVCLCRVNYSGDYCELEGTPGSCSSSSCTNGGECKEVVIGTTRNAFCHCPLGFRGKRCETRYFACTSAGRFQDTVYGDQGRYFECLPNGSSFSIHQRTCPCPTKFNPTVKICEF